MVTETPLAGLHRELGAKFVDFAGVSLPVHFADGILREHLHVRRAAGLFDVSHMGQIAVRGGAVAAALESLSPADFAGLAAGRQRYALFTNDGGGIEDDFMAANAGDYFYLVVNAARKEHDLARMRERIGGDCDIQCLAGRALLALQGPQSAAALAQLAESPAESPQRLTFLGAGEFTLGDVRCFVSRSGYCGEDGFEISLPAADAERFARRLLGDARVRPAGLGARDSLRVEAGLCLYGSDMDAATNPVEAGLGFAVAKARRPGGARSGGFPGAAVIFDALARGAGRARVGLLPAGRAPVRAGAELVDAAGATVGVATSGTFGASVGGPVAMGYVRAGLQAPGTALGAVVRGKTLPVTVAALPFTAHRHHRTTTT